MMCDIVIIASERAEDILYKLLLKKKRVEIPVCRLRNMLDRIIILVRE